MVSGLVTSPCDQLRIFSGEARLIRMASKSAIGFPRSKGLERYKVFLRFLLSTAVPNPEYSVPGKNCGLGSTEPESAGPAELYSSQSQSLSPWPSTGPHWVPGPGNGLIRGCRRRRLLLGRLDQLYIQAERLQLANQHVEGLGDAGLHGGFRLHDGLVNLGAAIDVVRLCGEQLLQDEGCAVGFQRPDFHFSEALAAELGLAAQRLLRDQRVRANGACVNLVVHQVREL